MSKRGAIGLAALLWLLEWFFGWTQHLGRLGDALGALWLGLFIYFVFESRHRRIPRAAHTWLWMIALLVVSVVRAWWLGSPSELIGLDELIKQLPDARSHVTHEDIELLDVMFDVIVVGLAVGLAGAIEATIIAVASWISDRFHKDREPPRVGLLSRIAITVLQAPIFLALMGAGLAAIGGATVLWTHQAPEPMKEAREYVPWIAGFGLAGWALATFHLGQLFALARGSAVNRLVLALIGILSAVAVVALGAHSVKAIAILAVWVGVQLLVLRFARD